MLFIGHWVGIVFINRLEMGKVSRAIAHGMTIFNDGKTIFLLTTGMSYQ